MSLAHKPDSGQRPAALPAWDNDLLDPLDRPLQIRPTARERSVADRLAFASDGGDPDNYHLGWEADELDELGRKLLQWEAEEKVEAGWHEAEIAEAGRWYDATLTRGGVR